MIGRRVTALVMGVCLASVCLPLSQAEPVSVHAAPASAGARVSLGCSSSPAGPYVAGCAGLTLGITVHLAAATSHALGVEYQLWITCRRVEPLPVVGCGRNESTSSPFLINAHVRNAKSYHHIVAYDFQAWLVYHPSGTPIVIKKSNVVRVSWAPKFQVIVIRRAGRLPGNIIRVSVAMTHGHLENLQFLDLRIINGPGRFTTIGTCRKPSTAGPGAESCIINVNCNTYRAQIEVEGRATIANGEVTATSEPLFLCRGGAPPPPPGNATWVQIPTPCTATSDHPNRKPAGNGCRDGSGDPLWIVGGSSASYTAGAFYDKFQYTVPTTIPPGGAAVKFAAQEKYAVTTLCVGSNSDFPVKSGENACIQTPPKDATVESQASGTVNIESYHATKGSKAILVISLAYGSIEITYTYQAQ